jgi:HTH-type transcriptional regulator / antitoxin HigA
MAIKREKYLDLMRNFPPRPIRSERDLDRATRVIDSLIDRPSLSSDEKDYLNVLSDLVETYEAEHYPMAKVSDARMVRHLMEAKGVNQTEVAQATGIANSTISAVLKGTRQLTREHIGRLAIFFHVDPGAFIFGDQERPRKKPARKTGVLSRAAV